MIELRSRGQLSAAIEHARREARSLVVRMGSASRQYVVANRAKGTSYVVEFSVRGRRRFGHCSCMAGQHNIECKHLAAALGLHLYVAQQGLLSRQHRAAA